ncbi:MAG: BPSS1780 family membrane protein [Pseudomonadota bacterium]
MNSQYNVVFTGELKPGTERESFIKTFSDRFQCDEAKAIEILDSGSAVTLKKAVTREVAEKFREALEAMGMMVSLTPAVAGAGEAQPHVESMPAPEADNPYQAPRADLNTAQDEGEMSGPVSVPFGNGFRWITTAFRNHFMANPMAWIGAFLIFFILSIVIQIIPLLGPLAISLLSPVFIAGFAIGARAQDMGEDFTVGHLFSGFQQHAGQLMLIGLLYLVGMVVIGIVFAVLLGGSMAMFGAMDVNDPAAAQAMAQDPTPVILMSLFMALLFIPLLMAYWFAPALVSLDGVSAVSAMRMSFMGCLKNILPFLLYGIVSLVLMLIASLPVFLGLLVLLPVMVASLYTSYRDIFYPDARRG